MKDNRTILYVDLEINNINSLRAILRKEGYHIISTRSSQEGFDILQKQPVSVVICGSRVDSMKGVEFLAAAFQSHPDTSRLLVSAYRNEDADNRAHINGYLVTPWDETQVKSILNLAYEKFLTRTGRSDMD